MATAKKTEPNTENEEAETEKVPAPPADAQPPLGPDPHEDAGIDVPQTTEVLA